MEQLRLTFLNCEHEGSPRIAGPGVSVAYQMVSMLLIWDGLVPLHVMKEVKGTKLGIPAPSKAVR